MKLVDQSATFGGKGNFAAGSTSQNIYFYISVKTLQAKLMTSEHDYVIYSRERVDSQKHFDLE